MTPTKIEELAPDGIRVLLMRRTSNETVKTAVGCRWPGESTFRGWFGARPPTHWVDLPTFPRVGKEKSNG